MNITELMAKEFEAEMNSTRRIMDKVPMDRADYLPHAKSMTVGRLATHVVGLVGWLPSIMSTTELDLAGMDPVLATRTAASHDELLKTFEENVKKGLDAIRATSEAELETQWTLRMGTHVITTMPRYMVFRQIMMNHVVHHRAQLTVYLRLLDIPVPGLYGPSADEAM
jgi:uncharacterized damage-inducible protein DinB